MNKTEQYSVLLDCSFFIRLLKENDPLHKNAYDYFKYFVEHGITCYISTIAIAEDCVKGEKDDLPFEHLQVIPFNINHSIEAGRLCGLVYSEKERRGAKIYPRAVVPNDTKMFAQANVQEDIRYFVSSDSEAVKIYEILNDNGINFEYIDIHQLYSEKFGVLPL